MPQASDDLRQKIRGYYGGDIMDRAPLFFLLSMGWSEHAGLLSPPKSLDRVSDQEFYSALFSAG